MTKNDWQSRNVPVQEDMKWQRIEWRLQKVGCVLLFLFVIAGACGFFSKGFISEQQISATDNRLTVEYERFGRRESTMDMTLQLQQLRGERYQVMISADEMDLFQIQTLQPQPDESWSNKNQLILSWQRRPHQTSATVWLSLQPKTVGRFPLQVTLDNQSRVAFSPFIYP